MSYYIYLIENIHNGKVYIGQTNSIENRWYSHRHELKRGTHRNKYLNRAWKKHGEGGFQFLVLMELKTAIEANEAEIFYIDWFKQLGLCYNTREGGNYFSPESRERVRQFMKGRVVSAETRKKLSDAAKCRRYSEEYKQQISRRMMGNSNARGHVVSDEAKAKMAAPHIGEVQSAEHKAKRSAALKGRPRKPHTEETRRKMSLAKLGKTQPRAAIEKRAAARRGKKLPPFSEEHRRKISEARKAYYQRQI